MAGRGGYQKPSNPAPVSGPGSLSKRTDGGPQARAQLPDAAYGEQKQFQADQAGAPMQGAPAAPSPGQVEQAQTRAPIDVTGFGAPSQRPDEPVTAGAQLGAGPGLASMGLQDPATQLNADDVAAMAAYLPYLTWMASQSSASPSMQAFVRQVRSRLT